MTAKKTPPPADAAPITQAQPADVERERPTKGGSYVRVDGKLVRKED